MRLVVDASVAVKWFVREVHADAAKRCFDRSHELSAPDLIWPEFGNVLWKKVRRGELAAEEARGMLADLRGFPLAVVDGKPLIERAFDLAQALGSTVYDSLYLALAIDTGACLVTADWRFRASVIASPLAGHILWVEDL
jgi:predicted nucleic acid-binding protein